MKGEFSISYRPLGHQGYILRYGEFPYMEEEFHERLIDVLQAAHELYREKYMKEIEEMRW